jgi:hypothetical protein
MYKQLGATIEKRDGETLVSQIKEDIEKLVQEKMASVQVQHDFYLSLFSRAKILLRLKNC